MTRIAHLTDLHFGASDPTVVTALATDLDAINPDVVVVTGDITQSGSRNEFAQARGFFNTLTARRLIVPGNHDVPSRSLLERAVRPYHRFTRYMNSEPDPHLQIPGLAIAGINSARRARAGWNWSLGSVSNAQIARSVSFLDEVGDAFRVLALHHPLITVGDGESNKTAKRAGRLLDAVLANGVDLILCGHSHRPLIMELSAGDRPDSRTLIVQSSTATSHRQRGPDNGYTTIDVAEREFVVTPRTYDGRRFESSGHREYPRLRR